MRTFPLIPSISTGGSRSNFSPDCWMDAALGCSLLRTKRCSHSRLIFGQRARLSALQTFLPLSTSWTFQPLNIPPPPLCSALLRLRQPCPSSGEEMPSPEEVYFEDSPASLFVLPLLSSPDGSASQPAPPTWPPSPPPGLLASGLNID